MRRISAYFVIICSCFLLSNQCMAESDGPDEKSNFHVDIAAVGAVNLMYGVKNKSALPGATVSPELRLRFGKDTQRFQFFFTPFGYAAVNGFLNAKSASE